jgi:hypothetical protein
MIRLGRASIISDCTFMETIPKAAQYSEQYLRAVVKGIQEIEPPVELDLDEVQGAGVPQMECLVVTPTEKRLKHYKSVHFGQPMGGSLQMGYYLIGGDRAQTGSLFGGDTFGIGRPTDADVHKVISIVELIRDYAVAPAVQQIADLIQSGSQRQGGFLGL